MAAAPAMQMDGVGTAPPWLRSNKVISDGSGMVSDPIGGMRGQLAGLISNVPAMGSGAGGGMGGQLSALTAALPGSQPSPGGAPAANNLAMSDQVAMTGGMHPNAGLGGMASSLSNSMGGAPGGPAAPSADMTRMADSAAGGNPVSPSTAPVGDNLRQTLESNYDNLAGSGSGSSALQPNNPAGVQPPVSKSRSLAPPAPTQALSASTATPTPAATTPAHVDTGVGVDNPYAGVPNAGNAPEGYKYGPDGFLQSDPAYYQKLNAGQASAGGTPVPGASTPGAGPAAAGAQTPSGIITGSQESYRGGPNVTTAGVNYAGMPDVSQDFSGDAQRASDAAYKGATTYFDTDFQRQNQDLAGQLAAQGFAPGSEGFNRQMELAQRSQDTARTQAAQQAQQVGFQQSGDLMQRALAARQQAVGEQQNDADRAYNESLGIAGLGLQGRGQDMGLQSAQANAAGAAQAAGANRDAANYRSDLDTQIQLRQLGLQGDNQSFNQAMQLAQMSQGAVPGLNFGSATPLDVSGAYGIASANNNANLNRSASNTNALYNLGGSLLGSYLGGK